VLNDGPPDIFTGVYGSIPVPMFFGMKPMFFKDQWPAVHGAILGEDDVAGFNVPDLDHDPVFQDILSQLDEIHRLTGSAQGFLNWQGVLNTAFRLRGQDIFMDVLVEPEQAYQVFDVIAETMIQGKKKLYAKQAELGTYYDFGNIGNCVVNMVSGPQYREHVYPYDMKIRKEFRNFAIHNCAWSVTDYIKTYAETPGLGYVDMGIMSDLAKVKACCPDTRRNVLYTSMDLLNKSTDQIRKDFEYVAEVLGPCDIGLPDIEADVPSDRILFALDLCEELSEKYG
jgi:hypothetical protein